MSEKIYNSFTAWWFIAGGSIHALWKNRKYKEIKHLAMLLPKAAWEIRQQEIDQLKAKLATIKTMLEEKDEAYNCMGHTNSAEIKRFIKQLLKEIKNGN